MIFFFALICCCDGFGFALYAVVIRSSQAKTNAHDCELDELSYSTLQSVPDHPQLNSSVHFF